MNNNQRNDFYNQRRDYRPPRFQRDSYARPQFRPRPSMIRPDRPSLIRPSSKRREQRDYYYRDNNYGYNPRYQQPQYRDFNYRPRPTFPMQRQGSRENLPSAIVPSKVYKLIGYLVAN